MAQLTVPLTTGSGINDVYIAEDRYAIVGTEGGVEFIDLLNTCASPISSGTLPSEVLCVAADTTVASGLLYVGTSGNGIYTTRYHALREQGLDFTGSLVQQFTTATTPAISSDEVYDIDVLSRRLLISTSAGVDFITDHFLAATRPLASGSSACQMTSAGEGYWIVVNSGVESNYDLFSTSGTGIINVDFEYNTTSTPAIPSNQINDLAVSPGSTNLLGFATDGGDLIVEESQFSEASSATTTLYSDEPVTSIDFSEGAEFTSGSVYLTSSGSARVFGLFNVTVSGTHFHTIPEEEALVKENTRGQSLVTGTVNVIRVTSIA